MLSDKDLLIQQLYAIEVIKTGNFTLKSGITSPVYIDLRPIISYPPILRQLSELLWQKIAKLKPQLICGVPYTALPLATCIALDHNLPMLICRKEKKTYGTAKQIEGHFQPQQQCIVIEDIITSGDSVLAVANTLQQHLQVKDIVVFLDGGQGGREILLKHGFNVHAVYTLTELLQQLLQAVALSEHDQQAILNMLASVTTS